MSKAAPSNAEIEATIKALRSDFAGITGFVAGEFVKIATANDGVIDLENPDFAEATDTLINADPRVINSEENVAARGGHSAVLSFTGTKQGIEEKIDKLIAKGADPEKFTSLRRDLDQLETDLRTQVASSEGIQELVKQKLTNDLVGNQIAFLVPGKSGELQGLPMDQKKDLTTKISDRIQLNDKNAAALLSADTETLAWINSSTNQLISSTLGNVDNPFVLDESKITPKNLEKIGQGINNVINQVSIVNDIAKSIENESGLKVSNERKAKILKDLAPELAQLDPEYLEKNRSTIVADLSKELSSKRTVKGRARGQFRISKKNREKIAANVVTNHLEKSEAFGVNKVSNEIIKQQLSNTEIANRLNEFSAESGVATEYTASTIPSDTDIAQMRKGNPILFDQLVLKTTPTKGRTVAQSEYSSISESLETAGPTNYAAMPPPPPIPSRPSPTHGELPKRPLPPKRPDRKTTSQYGPLPENLSPTHDEPPKRPPPPSQYGAIPPRSSPTHGELPKGRDSAKCQCQLKVYQ